MLITTSPFLISVLLGFVGGVTTHVNPIGYPCRMPIRWLPLIAGLIPFVGIHVCYLLSVQSGYLTLCIPYIDGCNSISATGRTPPASLLFRAIELPFAGLLLVLWPLTIAWLRSLRPTLRNSTARTILVAGTTGAIALIVYTTFLGTGEPFYAFMRRFGIYFYFLGVTFAQLFTALALRRIAKANPETRLSGISTAMLTFCLAPFALGLLNLLQKAVLPYETADPLENSIEWIATAMLQFWFIALYAAWRRTDFTLAVTSRSTQQ
jgi:hypothetical protein